MKLKINNASFGYNGENILENFTFEINNGDKIAIIGKNGSGKTMLMRAISGLITPTTGQVAINDKVLGKDISFPESIGILIENPSFLPQYSGFDNLKMIASIKNCVDALS